MAVCLLLASGCGSKDEATLPAAGEATKASEAAAADAQKLATSAQRTASEAAAALKDATATAGDSTAKAQGLIDTAKRLTSENKWSEALKTLNELANVKLTPEQQKLVESLKAQAQKQIEAMATKKATDEAGKAVGGLLKPKN